jgi:hypothetical protein
VCGDVELLVLITPVRLRARFCSLSVPCCPGGAAFARGRRTARDDRRSRHRRDGTAEQLRRSRNGRSLTIATFPGHHPNTRASGGGRVWEAYDVVLGRTAA